MTADAPRILSADLVLGRRITRLWSHAWSDAANDLCFHVVLFELDSGVRFLLPADPDGPWTESPLTADYTEWGPNDVAGSVIRGSVIRRILRRHDEGLHPGAVRVGLDSGVWLLEDSCNPTGIGAAGLIVLAQLDAGDWVDYFDAPPSRGAAAQP